MHAFTPEVINIPNDRRVMATTQTVSLCGSGCGFPAWGDEHPAGSRGVKNLVTRATRYVAEGRPVEGYWWTSKTTGSVHEMYVVTVSSNSETRRNVLIYVDSDEGRMDTFDEFYAEQYAAR